MQVQLLRSPMMSVDGWHLITAVPGNIGQKREGQTRSCFAGESTRYFGPEAGSRWQCRKLRLVSWPRKCQQQGDERLWDNHLRCTGAKSKAADGTISGSRPDISNFIHAFKVRNHDSVA